VIQSALFFAFGFLCAGLLALIVAPPLWRRAVALTKRRIEASMPLTLNEIQAGRDALRAESAVAHRRLEQEVERLKEKLARQAVEAGRDREALKQAGGKRKEAEVTIAALRAREAELQGSLAQQAEEVGALAEKVRLAETGIAGRAEEIERLALTLSSVNIEASNREIEAAAREAEAARLKGELAREQERRREAEREAREVAAEGKAAQEALKVEGERAAELARKLERTMAKLADREEALERCERELASLRAALEGRAPEAGGDAELGEAISRLAAEMVAMTAALEGPGSPIGAALAEPDPAGAVVEGRPSLAERVRRLREQG